MSFDPFNFKFTPPKTVAPPTPSSTALSTKSTSVNQPSSTSRAGQIAGKLDELVETSTYLQQAILDRTKNIGVTVDFNTEPDIARALSNIYGSNPPQTIGMPMFNDLLDSDIGVMQTEMALGNSSPLQVNIFQAADVQSVTRYVEKQLINSGQFKNQLPTMLRTLKGDALIFQTWKNNLSSYPAYNSVNSAILVTNPAYIPGVINAATVDLTVQTYSYMDDLLNRFGNVYSRVYRTLSEVNSVEQTINTVAIEYFYQPLDNIVRIISNLRMLTSLVHKPRLQDISDDLLNFAFTRLTAEVTESLFTIDQIVQIAITPFQTTIGSLGRMISGIQGMVSTAASAVKGIGKLVSGGLKGMVASNTCSGAKSPKGFAKDSSNSNLQIPGLANVSTGLYTLAAHLEWSRREANRHLQVVDLQFKRLAERRIAGHTDRLDLLCSMQSIDSLNSLATSIMQEKKSGSVPITGVPSQPQEVLNRVLTNLKTGSDTTFVMNGTDVVVNPPDIQEPSAKVKTVFARAGLIDLHGEPNDQT